MKKTFYAFVLAIAFIMTTVLFAACNEKKTTPPVEEYTITAPQSADYSVSVPQKAAVGTNVSVRISLKNQLKTIETVKANDTVCSGSEGTYSFTMPAENVTIQVGLGYIQTEIMSDDVLSWDPSVPDQICKALDEDKDWARQIVYFTLSESRNLGSQEDSVTITSLNPDVIPQEAIGDVMFTSASSGTMVEGGSFNIDLGKVSTGVAYIALHAETTSMTPIDATIIKRIEVVEFGELETETWKETLVFDLSSAFDELSPEYLESLAIDVFDMDHQYGSPVLTKTLKATEENMSLEIEYVPGHTFAVTVYYIPDPDQPNRIKTISLLDTISGGSSETGYDAVLKDGMLTFRLPDLSIQIQTGTI